MNKVLRVLIVLFATLFLVLGLRWLVDPAGAAAELGMTLMDGIGRSSQIGDVGALFIGGGIMMLYALVSGNRAWFYAPALVMGLVAVLRVLAWLVQDAALAPQMIAVEVVVTLLLLFAAPRLSREG
jgi:hypothetical protein